MNQIEMRAIRFDSDDEAEEVPLIPAVGENRGDDGHNLHHHLQLAQLARLDGEALGGGHAAQVR